MSGTPTRPTFDHLIYHNYFLIVWKKLYENRSRIHVIRYLDNAENYCPQMVLKGVSENLNKYVGKWDKVRELT